MKLIITPEKAQEIRVSELKGKELVAYRCRRSEGNTDSPTYAVLSKLGSSRYGFVPLNYSNSNPTFEGHSWQEAVEIASKNRQLAAFDSMKEMIEAMHTNKF